MQILAILAAVFIVWYMYKNIKQNKEAFSSNAISKSFTTMGFLALILIAFVAFCVFLLRAG